MIKLVYIRDYYIEGVKEYADKLLKELEENEILTPLVVSFIEHIKSNNIQNKEVKTNYLIRKRIIEREQG